MRSTTPRPMHAGANAFESVRPRGAVVTAADAALRARPSQGVGVSAHGAVAAPAGSNTVLVFNCRGLRTVGLAPRAKGAICIESRAQAQASLDKSRRIARDWRQ